jgi:membrane protein
MATVRTALNTAWDVGRRHSFIAGKVVDLLLLAAALLVIAASLGITFVTTLVRHSSADLPTGLRGLAPLTGAVTAAGALLAAAALLFATFLMLYRFVSGASTRMHDVWPGAVIAAVGFEALQYGFSVYVSNFSHYNRVYGSLGAVVAFLFFVYLASWVFLFGAEVASEYPRMPPVKTTPEDAIGLPAPGQARTPPDGTGLSGPAGRARGMGAASGGGRAPSQVLNDASKPPFVGYRGP